MTTCWNGTASLFEKQLLLPLPSYPLEQLRQRFLYAVVDPNDLKKGARIVFQMAFETELSAVLNKLITLPADVPESNVCERRRFLDIDGSMRLQRYLIGPAIDALGEVPAIPQSYVELIRLYAMAPYPRYRTCALAATVCLATQMLIA